MTGSWSVPWQPPLQSVFKILKVELTMIENTIRLPIALHQSVNLLARQDSFLID
jgi:hypothetical protein